MKIGRIILFAIVLSILVFGNSKSHAAEGDMTVTPTRIIFEDRDRSSQVLLVNRGETRATFRIEFVQMRMDEDGVMAEVSEPNERELFADPLIRYSPRQVTLEPGASQTIRLALRKPADLAAGEYRSHLLFYAIPPDAPDVDVEANPEQAGEGFKVDIRAIFRISIPVIVRHGDLPVQFEIADLALHPGNPPELALTMKRTGRRSVYGDIHVHYEPVGGGERRLLRYLKDFVIYTSNDIRRLRTPLDVPEDVRLAGGSLIVSYSRSDTEQAELLAEARLPLP